LIVEHPNQAFGEVSGIGRFDIYRGLADETGIVQMQVREIGFTAWTAKVQERAGAGVRIRSWAFSTLAFVMCFCWALELVQSLDADIPFGKSCPTQIIGLSVENIFLNFVACRAI